MNGELEIKISGKSYECKKKAITFAAAFKVRRGLKRSWER
jgi:hypothetical protein